MMRRWIFGALILAFFGIDRAQAASIQIGIAAFDRRDNATAVRIIMPLAEKGNAKAQLYLGIMYANGYGVPQNFVEASRWYRNSSEQGVPTAQYLLGLMYDKGQGVPQDYVLAYKWLNLATANASGRMRQDWVRIRDAVALKLSLAQLSKGQELAIGWQAARRR